MRAGPAAATLRSFGDARIRDLVGCFTDAFETGDVDAILAMLVEDATFAMPPHATLYRGRDAIAASWLMPDKHPLACVTFRHAQTGSWRSGLITWIRARGATCRSRSMC
jgi:hypothetical protein